MKKIKRLVAVGLATLCVAGTMISASAAPSVASKSAGEFGTLTGSLEDSAASVVNGLLNYLFSYGTTVTKAPGATAKIYAKVSCVNNRT